MRSLEVKIADVESAEDVSQILGFVWLYGTKRVLETLQRAFQNDETP